MHRLSAILLIACAFAMSTSVPRAEAPPQEKIKAFCIDFNWGPGGVNAFAGPGHWADADPAEHVQWYEDLGANVIQTFCVSCNGYAWYKGGVVPPQPGLKHDFLKEVARIGHERGMRVMGYFCVGANTRWGEKHPELSYGTPSAPHIPFTDEYLEYLRRAIRDVLLKTDIDGFMIDWVWNPNRGANDGKWLDCEKKLYARLMKEPFPGESELSREREIEYGRKAIARCWATIRDATRQTNPKAIIWLSCSDLTKPTVTDSVMFKEVDWLMNERPDPSVLTKVKQAYGRHTRIVQCLCGWGSRHDAARVINDPRYSDVGFYGFAKPDDSSFPPVAAPKGGELTGALAGNARNIEIMRKAFRDEAELVE